MRVDANERLRYTGTMIRSHWRTFQYIPQPQKTTVAIMALGTVYNLLWLVAGVYAEFWMERGAGPLDTPVLGDFAWWARDSIAALPYPVGDTIGIVAVVTMVVLGIAGLPGVVYLGLLVMFAITSGIGAFMANR